MTGTTQPHRHLSKMLGRGCCISPEPGQCYFLGQSKSQRMKAMTECLGQGGRPCQEWGWSSGKGGGAESWLGLHRQISSFFQTGKSCLGCAHLQRVAVFTTLPGSSDFFLSFSQTQLVFFIAGAEQSMGSLPPRWARKHITNNSKSPARMGSML